MKNLIVHSENFLKDYSLATYKAYSSNILNYVAFLKETGRGWEIYDQSASEQFSQYLEQQGKSEKTIYQNLCTIGSGQ